MRGLLLLVTLLFSACLLHAQEQPAQQTPGAALARHIADKMADTLGLTSQQRAKILTINLDLDRQKSLARAKSADRAVVGKELQQVELERDRLYKSVLSGEQYILYLQKKKRLVTRS